MTDSHDKDVHAVNTRADHQREGPGGGLVPPMQADKHSTINPAVETPVEGRQGFLGRPVLAVLIAGLLLVAIAWLAVHFVTR